MKSKLINLLSVVFFIFFCLFLFRIEKLVFATSVALSSANNIVFNQENMVRPFYNVNDYGIFPDTGDNYEAIYNMIKDTVYKTGGTIYFPKGRYTTSYTIFIPENTTLLGDGQETEIYFDETDTWFGTGLANAGSNISIKNIKVSQKSKGLFRGGAQPGCIGFSDLKKEQAIAGLYVHKAIRGEVENLIAEDLTFDGFYPIQTENSQQFPIRNVKYKNLFAPRGCVSIMPGHNIEKVYVDNVVCDLFRLKNKEKFLYGLKSANINNINVQNIYINLRYVEDDSIRLCNVKQTNKPRNNVYISSNDNVSSYVSGNVVFSNCSFISLPHETKGMVFGKGIQKFYNCEWKYHNKAYTQNSSQDKIVGHRIFDNCKFIKN